MCRVCAVPAKNRRLRKALSSSGQFSGEGCSTQRPTTRMSLGRFVLGFIRHP